MIRPGDLLFVRSKGFMPWAIRQVTGGHFNHVEIILDDEHSIGANSGEGVRTVKFRETFKNEYWQVCRVQTVSDVVAKRIAMLAGALAGEAYDTRAILGVWFRFIFKRLGFPMASRKNDFEETDKVFCSELVGILFGDEGIKFTDDPPSLLTPTEIFECPGVMLTPEKNTPGVSCDHSWS